MEKKIIIIIFIIAGLFLAIVGPIGFFKAYKYYYSLPYKVPEGKIIFTSNRLNKNGFSMHILENGKTRNSQGGLKPRFVRSTGETVSWGGIGDDALYLTDKHFLMTKKIDFTKKLKIYDFDVLSDGGKICFTSNIKLNNPDLKQNPDNLFVINMDGSGLKQFTNLEIQYLRTAGYPRWSPDGNKIVLIFPEKSSNRESPALSIYLIDLVDGNLKDVLANSDLKGDRLDPSWSPDGKKITFVSYRNMKDSDNIYIMNADGTAVTRITDSPYVKRQPVFSPDGTQICYVGYPHGISNGGQLFIVDLKTKKEYRVTRPGRVKAWPGKVDDRDPDWHE